MIILLEIILNTIKLLLKKKSFIVMGILAPAIVLIFFSFAFGNDITYKVGIVDKDNNYISNEIIETINNIEDV
ncbi:MAG: ABC transporter permease, partial [Clostridium celatum]|nr:ABC transporter permease [Clostridium celatum]